MYKHMSCENMLEIQRLVNEKYISTSAHPSSNGLVIYNYTRKTQFESKWVAQTKWCRGMVIDDDLNIVIECPPKFFNQGEPEAPDVGLWDINDIVVSEKLDGYYVSIRKDSQYGLIVTSRGSFDNKYVDAAKKLMPPLEKLETDISYFCELCQTFEEDVGILVMQYDKPSLVLWGVEDKTTGKCRPPRPYEGYEKDWVVAKQMPFMDYFAYLNNEVEGVVLFNEKTYERVKVKTEWYLRTHREISGITMKNTFRAMREGRKLSEEVRLPEEHKAIVMKWETQIENSIKTYNELAIEESKRVRDARLSCKEYAMDKTVNQKIKPLVLNELRGKDYQQLIWRMVKQDLLSESKDQ